MKRRTVLTYAGGGGSNLNSLTKQTPFKIQKGYKISKTTLQRYLLYGKMSIERIGKMKSYNLAFTMAEILLSLTIIGVVAAITLPSLTGNINERTWNTQRKALYARFSQAIALMPALNGYGTITEDENGSVTEDTAAETFITDGLAKVLKINNVCDNEHLEDCGLPSKINILNNGSALALDDIKTIGSYNSIYKTSFSWWDGSVSGLIKTELKAAAFETSNGESILTYYNPNCSFANSKTGNLQPKMCANFLYDLNGSKGPNQFGKDIGFITAFYPTDTVVVAPNPVMRGTAIGTGGSTNISLSDAQKMCRDDFDNARIPNLEELMAMVTNRPLFGLNAGAYGGFHSATTYNVTKNYHVEPEQGNVYTYDKTKANAWCINR